MANETWKFVQAKSKQAMSDEAGARHQKRDCMHEGDAAAGGPPLRHCPRVLFLRCIEEQELRSRSSMNFVDYQCVR